MSVAPRSKLSFVMAYEPTGEPWNAGPPLLSLDAAILRDVKVSLAIRLGEASLTVEELLELRSGSVVKLDRLLTEPIDLQLNGAVVARGEIVAVDDNFGVRILEIAPGEQ